MNVATVCRVLQAHWSYSVHNNELLLIRCSLTTETVFARFCFNLRWLVNSKWVINNGTWGIESSVCTLDSGWQLVGLQRRPCCDSSFQRKQIIEGIIIRRLVQSENNKCNCSLLSPVNNNSVEPSLDYCHGVNLQWRAPLTSSSVSASS